MEEQLLARWADRAGLPEPVGGAEVVHGWGDMEVAFAVTRQAGAFAVAKENRGSWSTIGRFSSQADADSFLIVCFGAVWRANEGLGDVFPAASAAGSAVTRTDDGWVAESGAHRGVFTLRSDAKRYTYVAGKSLEETAEFMQT